ncbi:cellulase family glycosylhydrolase [Myceligenerans xiligouense]|uniref:Endoglucanase n=1 Tax=Myceligenerans xiligouense TaxID=253184 RepID=A0A3N4ZI47_9MICO|nr:cellulase family glycosylhydrolase [Myceligenerans xiligouense]RPF19571.1 mannan endo-1,4-beta-mannosidase [Myceligenerans xiligouense]
MRPRRKALLTAAGGAALLAAPLAVALPSAAQSADTLDIGIHVEGDRIVEADGSELLLRGVSHAHTWYLNETGSFADIDDAGANAVRVVLSDGTRWNQNGPDDVANVVDLCWQNELICVLEDHDTTGYGEEAAASTLDQAVDYWISLLPVLEGTEDHVIVNIGNEPYGNDAATNEGWAADTSAAIQRLRDAGFDHTIVVDAPNWGQDWQGTMRAQAPQVAAADPDGNTVFSVHMYGVYATGQAVTDYIDAFDAMGLPLIVGEFGHDHSDGNPDEDTIMSYTRSQGIGWFAWSWSGNGGGVEYLDMVRQFDPAQRTDWGDRVITGPDGLSQTSVKASVFGGGGPEPTDEPTDDPTDEPTDDPTDEPTDEPGACEAAFEVVNDWGSGFQGQVTVTGGSGGTSGWTTQFTLPSGTSIGSLWNADHSVSGSTVTASDMGWNGTLSAGQSTSFGFTANGTAPSSVAVTCAD